MKSKFWKNGDNHYDSVVVSCTDNPHVFDYFAWDPAYLEEDRDIGIWKVKQFKN